MGDWIADRIELHDLNTRYARALDSNDDAGFVGVFAPGAYYSLGPNVCRGHEELARFFAGRQAGGKRVTRHIFSGLAIEFQDRNNATGHSTWVSFVGGGEPPFSPATPFIVADCTDVYLRVDSKWLFSERRVAVVFKSDGGPSTGGAPKP